EEGKEESQYDRLRRLQDRSILPRNIFQLFDEVRREGNEANHALKGDHGKALSCLKICWQLGVWFHRTFKDAAFKSGPFIPPDTPRDGITALLSLIHPARRVTIPPVASMDESLELRAELERLAKELSANEDTHKQTAQRLEATEASLKEAQDER